MSILVVRTVMAVRTALDRSKEKRFFLFGLARGKGKMAAIEEI